MFLFLLLIILEKKNTIYSWILWIECFITLIATEWIKIKSSEFQFLSNNIEDAWQWSAFGIFVCMRDFIWCELGIYFIERTKKKKKRQENIEIVISQWNVNAHWTHSSPYYRNCVPHTCCLLKQFSHCERFVWICWTLGVFQMNKNNFSFFFRSVKYIWTHLIFYSYSGFSVTQSCFEFLLNYNCFGLAQQQKKKMRCHFVLCVRTFAISLDL